MKRKSLIFGALIGLVVGVTGTYAAGVIFKDMPADHWAKNAVDWASNLGVVKGYPDETFRGNNEVTRYEVSQMLYNFNNMKVERIESETNELQEKADLRKIGYIKKIYKENDRQYIEFDEVQWLSGKAAKEYMVDKGTCETVEKCEVPPPSFLIVNDDTTPTIHEIREGDYRLASNSGGWDYVSFEEFKSVLANVQGEHAKAPYWIEFYDEVVTSAQQQFLP